MEIAFLSSTQQHSAALSSAQFATNFKVSLLFAKFQFEERYMNIQKPTHIRKYLKNGESIIKFGENNGTSQQNTWKKDGKRMEIAFLSSTQQHSAALSSAQFATNFKVSLLFAKFQFEERYMNVQKPTNIRKYLKNQKNTIKFGENNGKHQQNTWKKDGK